VTGPDGAGRAEVQVVASPLDALDEVPVVSYTEVSGAFELVVSPGRWLVHVETPAYQLQWFRGKPSPFEADVVEVAAGDRIDATDFALKPQPAGRVKGRVTTIAGDPIHRALVMAVPADDAEVGGGGRTTAAFTNQEGAYRLHLEPGTYALGASPTWRTWPSQWWDGRSSREAASLVVVGVEGEAHRADFVLGSAEPQ
jgi:hypothetical protein